MRYLQSVRRGLTNQRRRFLEEKGTAKEAAGRFESGFRRRIQAYLSSGEREYLNVASAMLHFIDVRGTPKSNATIR